VIQSHNDAQTRNILLLSALCLALVPELAAANVLDNFGSALLGILNSTFLRSLAIVALIGAGLLALSGRIQWLSFLTVLLAVVIVFGAAGIVDYIRDNAATAGLDARAVFAYVA